MRDRRILFNLLVCIHNIIKMNCFVYEYAEFYGIAKSTKTHAYMRKIEIDAQFFFSHLLNNMTHARKMHAMETKATSVAAQMNRVIAFF